MAFGLGKGAVLEMRIGRQVCSCGIELPNDQLILGEIEEEGLTDTLASYSSTRLSTPI